MSNLSETKTRRYELDWLRVILIFLVFLHHVAMPFNGDDWHIMNNEKSKLLDDMMVFFEQWRLPLLFLISGAGTILATSKRNSLQFIKERSKRLLIPLIFGACFIVPPQIYFQFFSKFNSYFDLYPMVFTRLETNHLWFIEYLFIFSILAIPMILFLRSNRSTKLKKWLEVFTGMRFGLFLFVVPFTILIIFLKQYYPSNSKDILNLSSSMYYLFYFVMGMIIASTERLWDHLKRYRKANFILFVISFILFYGYYYVPSDMVSFISIENRWNLWYLVCHLVSWSLIITILGYAQVYFVKSHKWLKSMNEGIYPFYIFHQTVIVGIAFYVVQWDSNIFYKLVFVGMGSLAITILLYRYCVYPFNFVRPLFGLKKKQVQS